VGDRCRPRLEHRRARRRTLLCDLGWIQATGLDAKHVARCDGEPIFRRRRSACPALFLVDVLFNASGIIVAMQTTSVQQALDR
jgi:hypothetical protein